MRNEGFLGLLGEEVEHDTPAGGAITCSSQIVQVAPWQQPPNRTHFGRQRPSSGGKKKRPVDRS